MKYSTGIPSFDSRVKSLYPGDIGALYGDKNQGKTLFLLSFALEIKKNNPKNDILFITKESPQNFYKKIVSSINKLSISKLDNDSYNDINLKYQQTIKKFNFLKNFNIIHYQGYKGIYETIEENLKKMSNKKDIFVFVDDLDKMMNHFHDNNKEFLEKFKKFNPYEILFFTYSFSILGDWQNECSSNIHMRLSRLESNLLEIEPLDQQYSPIQISRMGSQIYGFYGKTNEVASRNKKCTCGASSLTDKYGDDIFKFSRYHSHYCGILPLED